MTNRFRRRRHVCAMTMTTTSRFRGLCLLAASLMAGAAASAKDIGSNLTLDSAALPGGLLCRVMPEKPELGFDLRFHAAYQVILPLKELAEVGSPLKVTITVTPRASEEPAEFVRWFRIPDFPQKNDWECSVG